MVRVDQEKVRYIQNKLLAAQSRQKEHADRKVRDMDFKVGEQVLLKVSPMKKVMRFGKRGKLSPWYNDPFEIFKDVGIVAYSLVLPSVLSRLHLVFHISMLKSHYRDGDYIIKCDSILLVNDLADEEKP